jgi:hypothetical protein
MRRARACLCVCVCVCVFVCVCVISKRTLGDVLPPAAPSLPPARGTATPAVLCCPLIIACRRYFTSGLIKGPCRARAVVLPSVSPDPVVPSPCSFTPLGTRLSRNLGNYQDLPSTGSRSCIGRVIGSPAEGSCVGPHDTR